MAETTDANTNAGNGSEAANGSTDTTNAPEAKSVSDLPKWAQDELSRARNDAASYRTKLRETEAARDGLKTSLDDEASKKTALEVEVNDLKLGSTKLDVALEAYGVEKDKVKAFADRLRGATPEELAADGKSIMETFGVAPTKRATDRSAGLGNEKPPTADNVWSDFVGDKLGWGK